MSISEGLSAMRVAILSMILLAAVLGCRSTEDYLVDLERLSPRNEDEPLSLKGSAVVFDEGQLAHEALVGLAEAKDMTLWQAMLSLSHAVHYLISSEDALVQADAAVLVGRLTTRIPVPPYTDELTITEEVSDRGFNRFVDLIEARKILGVPAAIDALEGNDQVQREEAVDTLRELTGEDFGFDVGAWRGWWTEREAEKRREFIEASRGPLVEIGKMRFSSARAATAMFRALALWFQSYLDEELMSDSVPALMRLARQAVVLSLSAALEGSTEPTVRSDVVGAMELIRDPEFGVSLLRRLQRERDGFAAANIARTLRHYPGRKTIVSLLDTMARGDRLISLACADSLNAITGERHGEDLAAWEAWWRGGGDAEWP
jgi:hypothetical protein